MVAHRSVTWFEEAGLARSPCHAATSAGTGANFDVAPSLGRLADARYRTTRQCTVCRQQRAENQDGGGGVFQEGETDRVEGLARVARRPGKLACLERERRAWFPLGEQLVARRRAVQLQVHGHVVL